MISETMLKALNRQIELESYASHLYLSMSTWCDQQGLAGCVQFMRRQSDEERVHMLKIVDYLFSVDGKAIIPEIQKPPTEFESVQAMFAQVYAHEQKVSKSIFNLMEISRSEKDFSAENFLQWYVEEQREEEELMRGILDKINLIGDGPGSLYFIDKEIETINTATASEEGAE